MQFVEGTDLATLLETTGALSPERAATIVSQAARALAAAHRAGLIHRDVKPSNILLASDASAGRDEEHGYLIDFGIARSLDGTRSTSIGHFIGTPAYMAPERFVGDGDHRVDIYALGCVLYQTVTGTPPFVGTDPFHYLNAHKNFTPVAPSIRRPGIPAAFDRIVAHAMEKDPEDRYSSAAEMAAAIRIALSPDPEAHKVSADNATSISTSPPDWPLRLVVPTEVSPPDGDEPDRSLLVFTDPSEDQSNTPNVPPLPVRQAGFALCGALAFIALLITIIVVVSTLTAP